MDIKNLNIFRGRLVNLKLFGKLRVGLYKEVSVQELLGFVAEFREFCAQKRKEGPASDTGSEQIVPPIDNFRILQRLCEQYYVYEDTDRFQQKVLREVKEIIEEIRTDAKVQKEFEAWLDKTQDGVVSKLRKEHPELKEQDIKLFCYLKAGFTPTMISVFLSKDKSVVYNRVSRLKAKLGI